MIDTLTNTEDLAPLVVELNDHVAYLKWCAKEELVPGCKAYWRWCLKKWAEAPNPWLEWLRGKRT